MKTWSRKKLSVQVHIRFAAITLLSQIAHNVLLNKHRFLLEPLCIHMSIKHGEKWILTHNI